MPDPTGRTRVAVIFGGVSSEHEVSCLTAGGVTRAMDPDRYDVLGIGITPDGTWTQLSRDGLTAMEVVDGSLPRLSDDVAPATLLRRAGGGGRVATVVGESLVDVADFDVAFALLHGPFGEDGTIQGLFEMYGIPYVGSGVAGSAISMDKDLMKRALHTRGLPVGPWVAITPVEWSADPDAALARVREFSLPVFVKPARGGSSVGITRVTSYDDLPAAIAEAQRWDPKVIVEQGFCGVREVECAVLAAVGGGTPHTSLPGEIEMHTDDRFYDFTAKYLPADQVTLHVPADLPDTVRAACQDVAARSFDALAAEGLARVDMFVTREGDVYVNELNTLPGFTRTSMYPMMWAASGIEYPDLITRLLDLALARPLGLR
ncbi:D-alanine--D-alanine ligase family protein [Propionicicella superfundia]|uniref:D-alanine--D-alanine ligase family protein n=1 Tax=Propionicicella superfundia TaxID=348582 RepID=UPI00041602A4|nr:D-alanine--D-alanine ligase family protein [Propionicicella superfundia]